MSKNGTELVGHHHRANRVEPLPGVEATAEHGDLCITDMAAPPAIGFEGLQEPAQPYEAIGLEAYGESQPTNGTAPDSIELSEGHKEAEPLNKPEDKKAEKKEGSDLYFRDGVRRIDYVLAYRIGEGEKDARREQKRTEFEKSLKEEGIEIEKEDPQSSGDGKTVFVKLHATWNVLSRQAETLRVKMPIKLNDMEEPLSVLNCIKKIPTPFDLSEEYVKPEPNYFTAAFIRDREDEFVMEDRSTFFSMSQRNRMVHEILEKCRYDPGNKTKFGIDHMINNGSYVAAYPLHEGEYKSKHSMLTHGPLNDRHLLYEEWARPGRWYKKQPLNLISDYFGEKIGLYFAWLGFYTEMLTYSAIVGLIVFFYGCISLPFDGVTEQICNATDWKTFTMCPQCDERCSYWLLETSCFYSQLTYLFDNGATVFFAAFMSLWATMFCEFWKRRQNELDYDWDLFGFEDQEENCRPQFEALAPDKRVNPITKLAEPYVKLAKRFPRFVTSILSIAFMIFLVLAAVVGVIVYRIGIKAAVAASSAGIISSNASIITSITASCISLVIIMILQNLYDRIATWLTELELHRTETEYEDSYTFKMYFFAFVNYYSSSFYVAFFKGSLPGNPNKYGQVFGLRQEECDPAGCLQELFINLAIVMCGKQFFNNFIEIFLPLFLNFWRSRTGRKEQKEGKGSYDQWEKDFDRGELGPRGLFKEYLEMAVQFGFVTIFVAAFPLAPFFALVNNLMEIRLDAYKFVTQLRRPFAARAQDIGAWYPILVAIGNIAVLSNACVIAFTSDFIPRQVYLWENDRNMDGYVLNSLSLFNTSFFMDGSMPKNNTYPPEAGDLAGQEVELCRYRGFYTGPDPPYTLTLHYWRVFAMRLVLVLVYEHVIFLIKFALEYIVPDMPDFVKNQIKRENYLSQQALEEATRNHIVQKKRASQFQDGGKDPSTSSWVKWDGNNSGKTATTTVQPEGSI
ncbi:anoctamin-4-like isoform X7 [Asterias rubens]|uniref:anoctamin-4-like isoform X7 n=1 Tax=Asterias rubens TaxID=7604 RepID=UPI001455AFD6|nr:anoctamin-4-like isoform X7 [Asterias rubens]